MPLCLNCVSAAMQSNFTARPATLEHHVPSTNNDSHTATKVWYCCIDSTEATGTQKPLTPNRQKASQVLELRPPSLFQNIHQTVGSILPRESHAHPKHGVLCPSVRTSRSCTLGFCSPETCKVRVREQAAGTGWKLFQKCQEGKSLSQRSGGSQRPALELDSNYVKCHCIGL